MTQQRHRTIQRVKQYMEVGALGESLSEPAGCLVWGTAGESLSEPAGCLEGGSLSDYLCCLNYSGWVYIYTACEVYTE